jgi:ATP-binding protein involved in chromosome partitioning
MTVDKTKVLDALRRVKGPDLSSNLVDLGLVSEVLIKNERVYFSITVPAHRAQELEALRQAAEKVVSGIEGVAGATVVLTAERGGAPQRAPEPPPLRPAPPLVKEHERVRDARARGAAGDGGAAARPAPAGPAPALSPRTASQPLGIPGIKHLIAVASGKGGVGKSTTAVNLALGLRAIGLKAGIMDADIYGPSQPRLLGLSGKPQVTEQNKLKPMEAYGLKAMSMGFMVDEGTPIVWRGPMVVQALNQMLREVLWGELDVLIIDMPPGTGDVQLTMAQQVPLSGAVIVSTPQDLALIDARKGLAMFQRVNVPVLGLIENMSYFLCPSCGTRSDIFGHGGAELEAQKLGLPFLGGVPLHMEIRERSDSGRPIVATVPESPQALVYRDIAAKVWGEVQNAAGAAEKAPDLMVSPGSDVLHVAFEGGEKYDLTAEMLRVMSPSAEVQGHSPDQRVTVANKKSVRISELKPVGNYAVRIVFDDRHDTGLFTWDYLLTLGREKDERWAEYLAELSAKGLSRG